MVRRENNTDYLIEQLQAKANNILLPWPDRVEAVVTKVFLMKDRYDRIDYRDYDCIDPVVRAFGGSSARSFGKDAEE